MAADIAPNHFVFDVRCELESTMLFRTGWRIDQVRPEFSDLLCDRCAKIDEWVALNRGIPADVRVKKTLDVADAGDGLTVVSSRVADILKESVGNDVTFFPFQDGEYAVMWPLNVVEIGPDSPLDRKRHTPKQAVSLRETRCTNCNRPGAVTVRPEFGNYMPEDKIVGLRAEGRTVSFMLVVHNEIGDLLKAAGVSGWKKVPIVPFTFKG